MTTSQGELTLMKKYSAHLADDWYDVYVVARRVKRGQSSYEYFVHCDKLDGRFDRWMTRDCIKDIKIRRSLRSSARSRNAKSRKRTEESDPVESLSDFENELTAHIKYISEIELGDYEIETWYPSPYPGEYGSGPKLWICEFCFQFSKDDTDIQTHKLVCSKTKPPGKVAYCSDDGVSIYEADGSVYSSYCQRLCLLGKLFIERKQALCPVEKYLFYVLYRENGGDRCFIGYFSKEKKSKSHIILNSILVLPPYHRQGFGFLMISFSYHISVLTKTVGSPEKPLSDLGLAAYRNYWSFVIINELDKLMNMDMIENEMPATMADLSLKTGIAKLDICETLEWMELLNHWKNEENFTIHTTVVEACLRYRKLPKRMLKIEDVKWTVPLTK